MSEVNFVPKQANVGAQVAISVLNTAAVAGDVVAELDSSSTFEISVKTAEAMAASNNTGWSESVPLYREWGESTLNFIKVNANFKKVVTQFFDNNPTSAGFWIDLSLIWPKATGWTDVKDVRIHGFLSGFTFGEVNRDDIQKFSCKFKGSGKPVLFDGTTLLPANSEEIPVAP